VDCDNVVEHDSLLMVQEDQPTIPIGASNTEQLQAATTNDGLNTAPTTPTEQAQPIPLDFDLKETEGFRYRVEDVQRAVTKIAVRETRAAELRAEILNSERLQSHFEDNPVDLQLLRHDRISTHTTRIQDHLKHIPKYLLPKGMQVANLNRKRKRKKTRNGTGGARRSDNDPLQSFDGNTNLDGVEGDGDTGEDPFAEFMETDGDDQEKDAKKPKTEEKIYTNTKDGTGRSTAGRNAWKEKHKKGAFSGKKRLAEKKYKSPLGI
jgi:ATP-dependent RNA helicase DDX56/DBP9